MVSGFRPGFGLYDVAHGVLLCFQSNILSSGRDYVGVSEIRVTLLLFGGLYSGPLMFGNPHVACVKPRKDKPAPDAVLVEMKELQEARLGERGQYVEPCKGTYNPYGAMNISCLQAPAPPPPPLPQFCLLSFQG